MKTRKSSPARSRSARPSLEMMESRRLLSTTKLAAGGGGVDALAMGDVNVDRFADVAVGSHQGGHYLVTIYSGGGAPAKTETGYQALPLVTLTDPLGPGVGPLSIALGDFNGDGSSDLAVASTGSGAGSSQQIAFYSFQLTQSSPYSSPVKAVAMGAPILAPNVGGSKGLALAAADFDGQGPDELVVAPAGAKAKSVAIMKYNPAKSSWSVADTLKHIPVNLKKGLSVSAGDVTGDGTPDVVVGSKATGQVSIYDPALHRWVWTTSPLGKGVQNVRVAAVANVNAPGSIVVTGLKSNGAQTAAIVPWVGTGAVKFVPVQSPGSGALVPLSGGYVYQRSTITGLNSSFPISNGPVAPTVLFGSTGGSGLVVQGFTAKYKPSRDDSYVEPLSGSSSVGFWPLQGRKNPATGDNTPKPTDLPADKMLATNLVVYPKIDYTSPYSIDLSGAPASIYDGLFPYTSITATGNDPWGPAKVANTPPDVPAGQGAEWLRERLLAAYMTYIGVDYQHHHAARWTPAQGSAWNVTSTVGYQSQGIDCTNFTAQAYADALGVVINSDTQQQADITHANPNGTIIPASLNNPNFINIQTIDKSQWSSYQQFVSMAQPGDILIVNGDPTDASKATHAITWLGSFGKDKNGLDPYLIIDSTGTNPSHVNSNNQVVPEGVQIRPFGAPGSMNEWYYNHVDHILRIIAG